MSLAETLAEKYFSKANFEYVWKKIIDTFVKKESNKGLSTNDYTDDEKEKLSAISPGATRTVVEDYFYSTSNTSALSANKGRELNERVLDLESRIDVNLDGLTPEDEVYVVQSGESEDDIPDNTVIAIFPDEDSDEIDWSNYYNKAEINEIIIRADFKKGKSAYELAVEKGFEGTEEEWLAALKGEPFTYEDFTTDQLQGLKFKYEDFTEEQLASLKGAQGDPFEFEDFTPEQIELIRGHKGDQGDPFEYEDFTPEQLEDLVPKRSRDYWTDDDIALIRTYIDIEVSEVIDGAPELLQTLDDLAAAIGDDPNFAVTITNLIGTKASKDEIPKTLPANGGNADTIDGYHIRTGTSGASGYITFVV